MEAPAVLDSHTYIVASLNYFIDGFAVGFAPVSTVNEEHIGALRFCDFHAIKMAVNIVAGKIDVTGKDLPQFI